MVQINSQVECAPVTPIGGCKPCSCPGTGTTSTAVKRFQYYCRYACPMCPETA
ncbi:23152_t:CDS:2 [Dentiscutata erythropus]|uniref:23152_t:CDS:1 n=1 Tax=Dentiscutata erythropus TaxID=1348616 RepID=A0A9N9JLW6_9GLOM|nr:23152_t:CDS:2 [Dentiscutata erythropus]